MKEKEALKALALLVEKSIYGNKENNRGSIFEAEKTLNKALERLKAIDNAGSCELLKALKDMETINYMKKILMIESNKNKWNFIKLKSQQQTIELELHRTLFKQLNLQRDFDSYDSDGIPRTYEFYEIVSEDGMYINDKDTIETIKQIEKLTEANDE
jgi:hypothetical protein